MSDDNDYTAQQESLKVCVLCAANLKEKTPKLLPCLHSLCDGCLNNLFKGPATPGEESSKEDDTKEDNNSESAQNSSATTEVQQQNKSSPVNLNNNAKDVESYSVTCPACSVLVEKAMVIDNLFVNYIDTPIVIDEDEEKEEKEEVHICTACDENEVATSLCMDCREWLCDVCVHAHKRVRITKDHTISSKEELKKDDEPPVTKPQKNVFCQIHKHEPLKLFCETCDMLTCRDCQLVEHKDHQYQFMTEAISKQRELLQHAVVKVKQKLANYNQADKILQGKNSELKAKLQEVCDSIKNVTDTLLNEIRAHSEKLTTYLEKYVNGKTNVIADKQRLVDDAVLRMKHAVKFVENALTVGDDMSILYTKGLMMKILDQLSRTGIPFHPSILSYEITFEHEKDFLVKNIYKAGHLVIDKVRFPGPRMPIVGVGQPPMQPQIVQGGMSLPTRPPIPNLPNLNTLPLRMSEQAFFQHIQSYLRQYPIEKQREMSHRLYEKYKQRQNQMNKGPQISQNQPNYPAVPAAAIAANSAFSSQMSSNRMMADQAARNLNTMANGTRAPTSAANTANRFASHHPNMVHTLGTFYPQSRPGAIRPQPQPQPGIPAYNSRPLPAAAAHQGMQQTFSASQVLSEMSASVGNFVMPPTSNIGFEDIVGQAGGPVSSIQAMVDSTVNRGNNVPNSGHLDQTRQQVSPNRPWTFPDHSNKMPSSNKSAFESNRSPGAQAASQVYKTPSPAGAGFDQSGSAGPTNVARPTSAGQVSESSLESNVKHETALSSCAFSQQQQQQRPRTVSPKSTNNALMLQPRTVSPKPTNNDVSSAPPPLIQVRRPSAGGGKTMPVAQEFDPNEDYCAVCQNGGDLLCCDNCPKVFHIKCHVPELNTYPSGDWRCTLCLKDDDISLTQRESKDFVMIPGTGKRKAPTGLSDKEDKACERILLELYCHPKSTVFHEPVSKAVPNYYKIITNPIDFSKIKSKLQRQNFNHYNTVEDFISDMLLVFRNCSTYNDATSEIWKHGKMVEEEFETLMHRFLPCYIDYLDEEREKIANNLSSIESEASKQLKKKKMDDDDEGNSDTPIHFH